MQELSQPQPRIDAARFEALYLEYFDLLANIAAYKFRVPDSEAETLVHDVLLGILRSEGGIRDMRSYLVGAICHASRHYWRLNGRTVPAESDVELDKVDPASVHIVDSLPTQLAAREALERLSPRYQTILYMRFFLGYTVPEIAQKLGLKPKYTRKLVDKCLRRAELLYSHLPPKRKKP